MQIGHQVHDTDEDAQADGHWEIHNGEAYAEHDTHAECHQALPTYIVVQLALHVLGQLVPERPVLLGEYTYPVSGKKLVVQEYEEHVE